MKPKELTISRADTRRPHHNGVHSGQRYLGLKVGLTFAFVDTRAVISMAIPERGEGLDDPREQHRPDRRLRRGTLSAIIFVLPGLVIVGWWTEFPFWQSFSSV